MSDQHRKRAEELEPSPKAWKADVQPLHDARATPTEVQARAGCWRGGVGSSTELRVAFLVTQASRSNPTAGSRITASWAPVPGGETVFSVRRGGSIRPSKLQGLIAQLRPAALDEIGLGSAIENLADRARELNSLDVTLTVDLDPEVESTLYRVVQEAITNAHKHAHAPHVRVTATQSQGHVTAEIGDDGIGFDPEATTRGYGLLGMSERLAFVDGDLTVISSPGDGTVVRAVVPADSQADGATGQRSSA